MTDTDSPLLAAVREIDRQAGQMDAHQKPPVLISFDAIMALRTALDAQGERNGVPTGFDQAIADARNPDHRNYSPELARRIHAEKRMCRALVNACLERGYAISVSDGEDWPVKRSTDEAAIMAALFSTDEDTIVIRDKDGKKAGWFRLIYGNDGHDVVSDFSANMVCDEIWATVLSPLSDRIAEGR